MSSSKKPTAKETTPAPILPSKRSKHAVEKEDEEMNDYGGED